MNAGPDQYLSFCNLISLYQDPLQSTTWSTIRPPSRDCVYMPSLSSEGVHVGQHETGCGRTPQTRLPCCSTRRMDGSVGLSPHLLDYHSQHLFMSLTCCITCASDLHPVSHSFSLQPDIQVILGNVGLFQLPINNFSDFLAFPIPIGYLLNKQLSSAPVLSYPDPSALFLVQIDASDSGVAQSSLYPLST